MKSSRLKKNRASIERDRRIELVRQRVAQDSKPGAGSPERIVAPRHPPLVQA
jgi:hypothetical protein